MSTVSAVLSTQQNSSNNPQVDTAGWPRYQQLADPHAVITDGLYCYPAPSEGVFADSTGETDEPYAPTCENPYYRPLPGWWYESITRRRVDHLAGLSQPTASDASPVGQQAQVAPRQPDVATAAGCPLAAGGDATNQSSADGTRAPGPQLAPDRSDLSQQQIVGPNQITGGPDGPLGRLRFQLGGKELDFTRKRLRYQLLELLWDRKAGTPRREVKIEQVIRKLKLRPKGRTKLKSWGEVSAKETREQREKKLRNRVKSLCHIIKHDELIRRSIPYSVECSGGAVWLEPVVATLQAEPQN